MVDTYGRWTFELGTPAKDKCDADRIAEAVIRLNKKTGYKLETTIENVVEMILLHFMNSELAEEFENGTSRKKGQFTEYVLEFIHDCGGVKEFDYYC